MQEFTAFQYLAIDIAGHYGLDKLTFMDRLAWFKQNHKDLESLADQAEDKPLFVKSVQVLRDVQLGRATGHMVSLDAICSGISLMSALTGCTAGAKATGLIDTGTRPDAYTLVTNEMNRLLQAEGRASITVSRAEAKTAVMCSAYGSRAEPEKAFGENLDIYYMAAMNIAPGAFELMPELINTWQPKALDHSWTMPDGFEVFIPVMQTRETTIKVDELDGAGLTVRYKENLPSKFGLANAANLTHSVDSLVMRNMVRRCSYNLVQTSEVSLWLEEYLLLGSAPEALEDPLLIKYVTLAEQSQFVDPVVIPYINETNVYQLPHWYARKLSRLLDMMLDHKPFDLITIHDAWKASPVNCNRVRYWYKEILSEIAESDMLAYLLTSLTGNKVTVEKEADIADLIRESEYCLS